MLRIAICDDNTYLCHELEEMVLKAETVHEGRVSTKLFYNGESLCSFVKQGNYFDIIFLDIEMDKMDGIIAGKEIRNVLRDEDVQIIYISAHQSYAMQLFSIRPMDFLIKPVTEDKTRERLQKAKELLGRKNALYEYQMNGQSCFIALKRIQYLEVHCSREQCRQLEKKYIISNMRQGREAMVLRMVGDDFPEEYELRETEATLDEVYLYYFDYQRKCARG